MAAAATATAERQPIVPRMPGDELPKAARPISVERRNDAPNPFDGRMHFINPTLTRKERFYGWAQGYHISPYTVGLAAIALFSGVALLLFAKATGAGFAWKALVTIGTGATVYQLATSLINYPSVPFLLASRAIEDNHLYFLKCLIIQKPEILTIIEGASILNDPKHSLAKAMIEQLPIAVKSAALAKGAAPQRAAIEQAAAAKKSE
jgi:hypothetical protein